MWHLTNDATALLPDRRRDDLGGVHHAVAAELPICDDLELDGLHHLPLDELADLAGQAVVVLDRFPGYNRSVVYDPPVFPRDYPYRPGPPALSPSLRR